MKIVYWSPYVEHVGTIRAVINSAKSLKKYGGHDVCLIKNHSEWEGYEDMLESLGIEIVDFGLKRKFPNLKHIRAFGSRAYMIIIALYGFFQMRRYIKQYKADVVITNLIAIPAILAALSLKKKPTVIASIQGYPKFLGLDHIGRKYSLWMKIEDLLREKLWSIIYTKVDTIVCMTEDTRLKLLDRIKFEENRVVVVENPILDEDIITAANKQVTDDWFCENGAVRIVGIGRLTYQKDFDTFIKAVSILRHDVNIKAYIFGDGEDRGALEKLICELELQENLRLFGFSENPYRYLGLADIFLLSSRWEDPGHAILEAGFLRTLIVSTKCKTGPEHILGYGAGAWLCNIGDPYDMANKMKQALLSDANDREAKINYTFNSVRRFGLFEHYEKIKEFI